MMEMAFPANWRGPNAFCARTAYRTGTELVAK